MGQGPLGFMVSLAFGLLFAYLADCHRSVAVWKKGVVIAEPTPNNRNRNPMRLKRAPSLDCPDQTYSLY